jgi:hypothetical protein
MTKAETKEIIKCITLLQIDGENTKEQVKDILINMLPGYEEK